MEVYNRTIILIFLYALVAVCLSGVSAAAVINSGVGAIQAAPTLADITTSVFASSDGSAVVSPCDHVCTEGGCVFEYCFGSFSAEGEEEGGVEPRERPAQCPGGACKFKQCSNPTCDGGLCIFDACPGATCNGGACNFMNHPDTLKRGYCNGERCSLHGRPHPGFDGHLSI